MIFERFETEGLAHYSYAVGCGNAGQVAIVDPRRDVEIYIEFAKKNNLTISHVLETHIHADYASGARQLAHQTGASLMLSAYDNGEIYHVRFPHHKLHDSEAITLGRVRLQALHTPGHTPEHISYLVYDLNRNADTPMLMLSGDFLFVGSVGRPDLLGEDTKLALANRLYESVQNKLKGLPDSLEIHPGHGAGSMCGAGMSGRPSSTLGYERLANPYLTRGLSREAFVDRLLGSVPPFPPYYKRMKQFNSEGPTLFESLPGLKPLSVNIAQEQLQAGAWLVDLRHADSFGAGHVEGAINIGAGKNFVIWASWFLPYDKPLLLFSDDALARENSVRALLRVGLDNISGYLDANLETWQKAGGKTATIEQLDPSEVQKRLAAGSLGSILDVRSADEFRKGHIAQAQHVAAGDIEQALATVQALAKPLAVTCGGGHRASAVSSLLKRQGLHDVVNMRGGMGAWKKVGLADGLNYFIRRNAQVNAGGVNSVVTKTTTIIIANVA